LAVIVVIYKLTWQTENQFLIATNLRELRDRQIASWPKKAN